MYINNPHICKFPENRIGGKSFTVHSLKPAVDSKISEIAFLSQAHSFMNTNTQVNS